MKVALEDVSSYVRVAQDEHDYTDSLGIGNRIVGMFGNEHRIERMVLMDSMPRMSDSKRREDNSTGGADRLVRAGYVLLDELQQQGDKRTLIFEEHYLDQALIISQKLAEVPPENWRLSEKGTHLIGPKKERIKVYGYPGIETVRDGKIPPSCQVLDAAIYMDKLSSHDVAITVLNISYEAQQDQTRKILSWYTNSNEQPVIVVFHNKGVVVKVDSWSKEIEGLRKYIESELVTTNG